MNYEPITIASENALFLKPYTALPYFEFKRLLYRFDYAYIDSIITELSRYVDDVFFVKCSEPYLEFGIHDAAGHFNYSHYIKFSNKEHLNGAMYLAFTDTAIHFYDRNVDSSGMIYLYVHDIKNLIMALTFIKRIREYT